MKLNMFRNQSSLVEVNEEDFHLMIRERAHNIVEIIFSLAGCRKIKSLPFGANQIWSDLINNLKLHWIHLILIDWISSLFVSISDKFMVTILYKIHSRCSIREQIRTQVRLGARDDLRLRIDFDLSRRWRGKKTSISCCCCSSSFYLETFL